MNVGRRLFARIWLTSCPFFLAGCYAPHIIGEQDALYCESQGFRPGTNENVDCATTREATESKDGAAGSPPPPAALMSAMPRPPAHPGGVPQTTPRTVALGATSVINFSISVNDDCIFTGMPSVRIDTQPTNGVARVTQRIDFARLSQNGMPESCGDKKVSGMSVEYTANQNYIGSDLVEFEIITRAGSTRFKVPITVVKPAADDD